MDIVRVTDAHGALTCVRFESDAVGYRTLLRVIGRFPGVGPVHSRQGWPLLGNLAVRFTFRGHEFTIDTPFSDYCLQPVDPQCPDPLFQEIASYLAEAQIPWLRRFI